MNSNNAQDNHGLPPRVAVFIDGSNLYHSLDENCKRYDVDFAAFAVKLCKGRPLYRVYYYNVLREQERNPQAYQDQQKFLSALYNTPYLEVRLGGSKMRGDVAVEKGIDIMLATDLLRMAWDNLYDVAVLVTGDGDFAYAVQAAKDLGKHVEVAAFPANLSNELAQVADDRLFFNPEYFREIWSRRRRSPSGGGPRGASRSGDEQRASGTREEQNATSSNEGQMGSESGDDRKGSWGLSRLRRKGPEG